MACPLCQDPQHSPALFIDGYTIVRCDSCAFLFVCPAPAPAELHAFYARDEYYAGDSKGYANYLDQQPRHTQLAIQRLQRIERLLGEVRGQGLTAPVLRLVPRYPGGRGAFRKASNLGGILDVGCAAGFFMAAAQARGWQAYGIEIAPGMADHARNLTRRPVAQSAVALGLEPDSLAVVTMWEYIEHVPDPLGELRQYTKLLAPGGILALSTPNTGYWMAVHRPERWREFKPPAHVGFFTAATLRQALEAAGLKVILIRPSLARPPSRPYALDRMLGLVGDSLGRGNQRRTPLWWLFSIGWRLVELGSLLAYRLRWPHSDLHIGLEAYAYKR